MSTPPPPAPLTISMNRLWAIIFAVWATTLLCSAGVSWYAATVSADRSNQESIKAQCQSRQRARNITIDNARGNQSFYVSQVKEAKRQITEAQAEVNARETTPAEVMDAREQIRHAKFVIAHVPVIVVPATISC